ncbi:hypothetical protein CR532_04585 (plasmid) [Candidatus Borreliella tachyglossi]|uniref:Uncharacterized protein n=1 Tax=Candidatus Borreliella tachyglossi TaxID=1964448 RepID=A0A2S1LY84_9SPIR|nr:DUF777 family protein [Candidatus Borreliella tachyglossi]AWG43277.1 hypothetical protein CR532_04585 [Candidatus Borreliella tachyglossi]
MSQNYEVCRSLGSLSSDSLVLEDAKKYLRENLFICRIGIVKEFDSEKQEGIVEIPKYDGLRIVSRNISNLRLKLKEGDQVILLQSSINIFNEADNNYFDKHHFYILNAVTPECAGIKIDKFSITSKEFGVKTDKLNLNAENVSLEGKSVKAEAQSLIIEADSINFKGKVYINGKLFESHTHGAGSITYVNAVGSPTIATGTTSGVL